MMRKSTDFTLVLSLACLLGFTCNAFGQFVPPQPQPKEVKGTFMRIVPGGIMVRGADDKPVMASTTPERRDGEFVYQGMDPVTVKISGEVDREFLKAGMFVTFKAMVERKSKVLEPVTEITIIGQKEGEEYGVFPAVMEGAFDDEPELKEGVEYVLVAGQLSFLRSNGQFRLHFPGAPRGGVTGEVSPDAKVLLDSNNPSYARPGDAIEVKGFATPTIWFATEINVTHGKPIEKEPGGKPAPAAVVGVAPDIPRDPIDGADDMPDDEPEGRVTGKKYRGKILRIN